MFPRSAGGGVKLPIEPDTYTIIDCIPGLLNTVYSLSGKTAANEDPSVKSAWDNLDSACLDRSDHGRNTLYDLYTCDKREALELPTVIHTNAAGEVDLLVQGESAQNPADLDEAQKGDGDDEPEYDLITFDDAGEQNR